MFRYIWHICSDIIDQVYWTYFLEYIWLICLDIFDIFAQIYLTHLFHMYVAHKFVPCHSMGVAEIGDIKEMALRQKFELFIFPQASFNIYSRRWKIHPKTKQFASSTQMAAIVCKSWKSTNLQSPLELIKPPLHCTGAFPGPTEGSPGYRAAVGTQIKTVFLHFS